LVTANYKMKTVIPVFGKVKKCKISSTALLSQNRKLVIQAKGKIHTPQIKTAATEEIKKTGVPETRSLPTHLQQCCPHILQKIRIPLFPVAGHPVPRPILFIYPRGK
jgi:hypothetical protein